MDSLFVTPHSGRNKNCSQENFYLDLQVFTYVNKIEASCYTFTVVYSVFSDGDLQVKLENISCKSKYLKYRKKEKHSMQNKTKITPLF